MKKSTMKLLFVSFIMTYIVEHLYFFTLHVLDYFENGRHSFFCEYPFGECSFFVVQKDVFSRVFLLNFGTLGFSFLVPFSIIFVLGYAMIYFKENKQNPSQKIQTVKSQKSKVKLYSMMFGAVLFLHIGLVIFAYIPIFPSISASLGLIIVGFLFYEIYKQNKARGIGKYSAIGLIIIWILLCCSQIEYLPSKTIIVKDVFGSPIEGIAINLQDRMGSSYIGGGNYEWRIIEKTYITDSTGSVILNPRVYFGQRRIDYTIFHINSAFWNMIYSDNRIVTNNFYEEAGITFYKEDGKDVYESVLAPIKGDYRECNTISDANIKSKCLSKTLLYTAIKEKNPEICKLYDDAGGEIYNECLMFVGLLQNNPYICDDVNDVLKSSNSKYSDQDLCKCLFDSQYCDDYYKQEFDTLRPLFMEDMHNYLCQKRMHTYDDGEKREFYVHTEVRYLGMVSSKYREMGICEEF